MPPVDFMMVCVDYWDYLQFTLPCNMKHMNSLTIVTSERDERTYDVIRAWSKVYPRTLRCYKTEAFYDDGADFNKWKALEEAIDECWDLKTPRFVGFIDADVVWPNHLPPVELQKGQLWTPLRRMMEDFNGVIPREPYWPQYPIHRNVGEWAGYSQVFHIHDPVLLEHGRPWHDINWKHAGGADSFFQMMWPRERRVRPDFEVLHLGRAGHNWCGRAENFVDGTEPPNAGRNLAALGGYFQGRRLRRGESRFDHEKIKPEQLVR